MVASSEAEAPLMYSMYSHRTKNYVNFGSEVEFTYVMFSNSCMKSQLSVCASY